MAKISAPIQVNLPDNWVEQIVDRLKNDPESELVLIVRCKDCEYYLPKYGTCSCHHWDVSDGCQYAEVDSELDFCSYAERRKDG